VVGAQGIRGADKGLTGTRTRDAGALLGRARWAQRFGMLIALAGSLWVFATPASAAPDANCPGPSTGLVDDVRLAQTFTAQSTGLLTMGQFEIRKGGTPGDYVMQLLATDASGAPTNSVLASATIPDGSVPSGVTTVTGLFGSPAEVTAGQQYALAITRPGSNTLDAADRSDNPCPGREFASGSPDGPWTGFPIFDMLFSVFVEPDCDGDGQGDETQDPSLLGGSCPIRNRALTLDANKNKVKKGKRVTLSGRVTELVRQGECQSGQTVELQRKRPSQTEFMTVEQLQTDLAGNFSAKRRVKKTFEYRAQVAAAGGCGAQTSDTAKVKVKKPK
jgi:hypothetical protein